MKLLLTFFPLWKRDVQILDVLSGTAVFTFLVDLKGGGKLQSYSLGKGIPVRRKV